MKLHILLLLVIISLVFLTDCNKKTDDKEDRVTEMYYMQYKSDPNTGKQGFGEIQLCKQQDGRKFIMKKWDWASAGGGPEPYLSGPIFSPNGQNQLFEIDLGEARTLILVTKQESGQDKIINIDLGEFPETKALGESGSQSPLWFSDGEKFIFLSGDMVDGSGTGLYLYDIKTGKVKSYLKGWFIYNPRWCDPDYDQDKRVIFERSNEGTEDSEHIRRWDTMLFDLKTLKTKLLIPRTR